MARSSTIYLAAANRLTDKNADNDVASVEESTFFMRSVGARRPTDLDN